MADAKRDNNSIVTLIGVSSADGITPVAVWVDPVTHRMLVSASGGTTPGGSNTQVQYNNSNAFGGISGATTDGTTLTLVAPVLGAATATSINGLVITSTTGTLTIAAAKVVTFNNTLTFNGTDSSTIAFGAGGTVAYVANKLSVFAATSSAELAGVISDETGSGLLVFATNPTLSGFTMADATNIVLNTTTGTKFGTATNQKLAFYNSTPIVQPSGSIITALTNLGLVATPTLSDAELTTTDVTTNNVVSTKHGFAPKSPADATQFLNGAATPAWAAVKDSDLSTSDITTNNFTTAKHGFVPKGTNVGNFLKDDGTWGTPAGGFSASAIINTTFETAARFITNTALGSPAATTYDNKGANLTSGNTTNNYVKTRITWGGSSPGGGNMQPYLGSPTFNTIVSPDVIPTTASSFIGIGNMAAAFGTGVTYTQKHIGFKLQVASGTLSVYATQGDGTTESASAALTTLVGGDVLCICLKVNGSASVDYYYSKNGAVWSSATNITTNIPATSSTDDTPFEMIVSNNNNASAYALSWNAATYQK